MIEFAIDVSEFFALAADAQKAPVKVARKAVATTTKAAQNIKDDARSRVEGLAHAPYYPASITYETTVTLSEVRAEIGPDKSLPQGALGNLIEFGSVNNGPREHLAPALDSELPNWIKHLEGIAGDVW